MIDVYPTRIEARDESAQILFILSKEDEHCCTLHVQDSLVLSHANLEQVLAAVRRGVKMLELED